MSRYLVIICGLLCATFLCIGCTAKGQDTKETDNVLSTELLENQCVAEVLEVADEYLMVRVVKGHSKGQELQVWTELVKDQMPKVQAGDHVRITDRGQMTMSIPAQVSATEIVLVNDDF